MQALRLTEQDTTLIWALVVHGGAGDWSEARLPAALAGLRAAGERGRTMLESGSAALDVVCAAVTALEDDPIFNAGTGSVLNRDGEVEMDASVMTGHDLKFGAVAAIARVRNPILVARCVLERSDHALLAGEGAVRFARQQGFADYDPVTGAARNEFRARKKQSSPGTVGAVALDQAGHLAAATSTGGILLKLPGRVGDSPLPGAGNYASRAAAVSATGKGELMMRVLAAKRICDLIEAGNSPQYAVDATLCEMRSSVGSEAGFIALARSGEIGIGHDTKSMVHAWCRAGDAEIRVRAKAGQ